MGNRLLPKVFLPGNFNCMAGWRLCPAPDLRFPLPETLWEFDALRLICVHGRIGNIQASYRVPRVNRLNSCADGIVLRFKQDFFDFLIPDPDYPQTGRRTKFLRPAVW